MEKTGFPARKLNIEITESAKMPFDEQTIARLNLIKENDITLSLDDFGTGYSSFENLIKISADMLKTERLFLDKIENDPYRQYLLRVLADLAHFLDMRLVAEGVETETQYELLKDYGADYMQGYLFSKPLTSDELRAHVERFPPG
jgi:EAL domain-containing protein (putative c-di-GMP-specific phosphodiesterase class I)